LSSPRWCVTRHLVEASRDNTACPRSQARMPQATHTSFRNLRVSARMPTMSRVTLVTGGGGFIGSNIVRRLLERGDTVRVLDNFSSGNRRNLGGFDRDVEI